MGPREIGAQALARLQLVRLDQGLPVAAAPARQPGERTFALVDSDRWASATRLGFRALPLSAIGKFSCQGFFAYHGAKAMAIKIGIMSV